MEKAYTPEIHDAKWQKFWDSKNIAKPEVSHAAHAQPLDESFVVMMPPPNVTGVLHQGHALMLTLEDTLIRWERMRGKKNALRSGNRSRIYCSANASCKTSRSQRGELPRPRSREISRRVLEVD